MQHFSDVTIVIDSSSLPGKAVLTGVSGHFIPGKTAHQSGRDSISQTTRFGVLCIEKEDIPGFFSARMITVDGSIDGEQTCYEVSYQFKRPYVEDGCTYFQARVRP